MLRYAHHGNEIAVSWSSLTRNLHFQGACKILACQAFWHLHHFLWSSRSHHISSVNTCSWPQVNNPVCRAKGLLVMLHHHQGISQIPQISQGVNKPLVVPLVQANGGLIQNIQNTHETGTNLSGKTNTLGLTARKSGSLTLQGKVIQAHVLHKGKPVLNLLFDLAGNVVFRLCQLEIVKKLDGISHRKLR